MPWSPKRPNSRPTRQRRSSRHKGAWARVALVFRRLVVPGDGNVESCAFFMLTQQAPIKHTEMALVVNTHYNLIMSI